jgi:O-antigen/teichoic acid export membrane protein
LVLGDLLSRLIGLWVLWGNPSWVGLPGMRRIRRVLVRFRRFPLLMGPATILNVASQNFQSIFFPLLYGATQAGQLGVATRLTAAPAGLVSGAVGQVFSGELVARQDRPHEQRQLVLKTLYLSTMLALPFGFGVAIGADVLISLVLGESWGQAGVYAAVLSAGVAMSMIVSPISSITIVRNSLSTAFYFALAEFFIRGLPFALAMTFAVFSPLLTVVCISAGNSILYGVGLVRMATLAEITMVSYLELIRPLALVSLLCFSPAAAARMLGSGVVLVITLTVAGMLIYLMLALRFRRVK